MFNFQQITQLLLSCTLLTVPYIAQAANKIELNETVLQHKLPLSPLDEERDHRRNCAIDRQLKFEKKVKHLKLKDFAGEWTSHAESIGGVDGGTGASKIIDMQFSLDKHGVGTLNYFTAIRYNGVPGDVHAFTYDSNDVKISLEITDQIHGIGVLTIHFPSGDISVAVVTIRSFDGVVLEMNGHTIERSTNPTDSLVSYVFTRQYVE